MISLLPELEKKRWPQHLSEVTEAYNNTPHSTTGISPFYLMFGRDPITPVDDILDFSLKEKSSVPVDQYVAQHRQKLLLAHLNAYQRLREKVLQRQLNSEQKKPPLGKLEVGDHVRIKFHSSGKRKLTNVWTTDRYTVLKVRGQVITVIDQKSGKERVLNRCEVKKVGQEIDDELSAVVDYKDNRDSDSDED